MKLPQAFIDSLVQLGPDAGTLADALADTSPSVAVRVNKGKGIAVPAGSDIVPWCPDAFYLDRRPLFAADPAWHQGLYYVQDASSMAVGTVVATLAREYLGNEPLLVLDACAAPGGKSIAYLDTLPSDTLLVANEYDRQRAAVLADNIAAWGNPRVVVTNADARQYAALGEFFDIVAADMPCSGEGMMRKEEAAVAQWSPGLIASCADIQFDIALALWQALRPGGILIYSTCTFNLAENEQNIRRIISHTGAQLLDIPLHGHGIADGVGMPEARRFYPGRVRGEGLFIAALRKPEGPAKTPRLGKPKAEKSSPRLILSPDDYLYIKTDSADGPLSVALPAARAATMWTIMSRFRTLHAGVPLVIEKGRNIIPVHRLAMSVVLDPDAYPAGNLDYPSALAYLAGEAPVPADVPKGIYAPSWHGRPLGWAKNIGNRANTLMPAHLRLRLRRDTLTTPPSIIKE